MTATLKSQLSRLPILPAVLSILLVVRLCVLFSTIESVPRFVDEESNIYSTYYYKLFVLEGDFSHEDWENPVSYDYPPVRKYIYGLALHVFNGKTIESCDGYKRWHERIVRDWFLPPLVEQEPYLESEDAAKYQRLIQFCRDFLHRVAGAPAPPPLTSEDYRICRLTGFAFAVAATGLLSTIIYILCHSLSASLGAALVFLTNDVTMPGFQQALNDSMWCFFALLCLLLLFSVFSEVNGAAQWRGILTRSALTGVILALALQTKFIAAYMAATVVISFMGSVTVGSISNWQAQRRIIGRKEIAGVVALVTISSTALALFILLHPFLYHDTVQRIRAVLDHRYTIMQIQSAAQGPAIDSTQSLIEAIVRHGVLLGYDFDGAPALLLLYAYVLVVGLAMLLLRMTREVRCGQVSTNGIACAWILAAYLVVAPKIHMDWGRYFLPFVMVTTVLLAIGIGAHLDAIRAHAARIKPGNANSKELEASLVQGNLLRS